MAGPYGLTPLGYNLQRLPEFRTALEADVTAAFPGANVAVQSTFGQFIGILAAALAEREEQNWKVWQAFQIGTAEGQGLDNIGQIMGRLRAIDETDTAYRTRLLSVGLVNATPQNGASAMCSALQALLGVSMVTVRQDTVNCGYEVIILGGEDEDIAQTIYAYHPVGVNTFGMDEFRVESGCGFCQTIRFTRPQPVNVCLRMQIALLPGPCDCDVTNTAAFVDSVFQSVTTTGDKCALALGATFHAESFYAALLKVGSVSIVSAEFSTDGETTWGPGPLVLADTDYPVWNRACISITFA
jgi:uncharacterized phage protein gp47/JayE